MTRAIIVPFHKYTPFGGEFYEPILDFQLNNLRKYEDEYDTLYLVDSNWGISPETHHLPSNVIVIKVNPSLRYYDAYKEVLPQIKEDLVLFMDNDMVVYKPGMISGTFEMIDPDKKGTSMIVGQYQVATIMDQIGTWKSDKLNLGNKFCPYWFCTRKDLLMKYLDVDWSPDGMPDFETLGKLTKAMVEDGVKAYEMEDDKTDATFENGEIKTEKNLGYYHIRSGSLAAYLLATKHYGNIKTYDEYIETQPHSEIVRHCQWYGYMGGNPKEIYDDL